MTFADIINYLYDIINFAINLVTRHPNIKHIPSNISGYTTYVSSTKTRKRFQTTLTSDELINGCRLGLDSHADVTCVGKHAKILEVFEGRVYNVQPFNDSYSPMTNVRTVNAAFTYECGDGQCYVIEVGQALDFSQSMEHSLLCTNQARINRVIVDDVPKSLDLRGTSTHSIIFPDEGEDGISLPLLMHGSVSYLPVRHPTDVELDECKRLTLTGLDEPWDPDIISKRSIDSIIVSEISSWGTHKLYDHEDYDYISRLEDSVMVNAMTSKQNDSITAEILARKWNITIDNARLTLKSTTRDAVTLHEGNLTRRFKTKIHHTRYKQLGGYHGMFASDTFRSNITSVRGKNYIQLFCNRANFTKAYSMKSKSHAHHALDRFIHEVGVMNELLTDGAKELTLGQWGKTCRKHKIHMQSTEPHSPWQNPAELSGGIIKRAVKTIMRKTNTPVRLWDYCWEYLADIRTLTTTDSPVLEGVTPFQNVHGYTPDIAEYLSFEWFQWIWYFDPKDPESSELGRWLGPSTHSGQNLAFHILKSNGEVITRSTVSALSDGQRMSQDVKMRQQDFTNKMESAIGNYTKPCYELEKQSEGNSDIYDLIFEPDDLSDQDIVFNWLDDDGNPMYKPDAELFHTRDSPHLEANDKFVGTEVCLPHDGVKKFGTVVSRKRDSDGMLIGTENQNPILDTRVYNVDFGDGNYGEYSANLLIENINEQVDEDGHQYQTFKGFVDHRKSDEAVDKADGFYVTKQGTKRKVITTKGWSILTQWDDGQSSWIPLADAKESNPIQLAEYAQTHDLLNEPAFAWWAKATLKKRRRIIKQVRHRAIKKNVKFGVKVPSSIEESEKFDLENGNHLWRDAINKEIANVKVAFQLLDDDEKPPPGSKEIRYHFVFDVKFDLTRKARCVAGGHLNKDVPTHSRYSSVASRDSVRIGLLLAALNDIEVNLADIGNAYLNAPPKEKVHVKVGAELFGPEHRGHTAIIVRALYGLKSAGNAWRHHLASYIRDELNYKDTIADPDVYRRAELKPNGDKYYSYLIVYVDDILCIHHDPKSIMSIIGDTFRLKGGIVENPEMYLGTDLRRWKYTDSDGCEKSCWALGANSYVKEAIRICEAQMKQHNLKYTSTQRNGKDTPYSNISYRPELDSTDFCAPDLATVYQNLIGILRWICELGRIDVLYEVSILSQYLAQPRMGHLTQATNIFYYLKHHSRTWLVLDPSRFDIDWQPVSNEPSPFDRALAMKEIYVDTEPLEPVDAPEPRGKPVDITVFVDADHAGNAVTRRSHTGIVFYLNLAPITWYSKKQNTIETSTFGSEFIALKIAAEQNEALIYKLKMFGVPIEGPSRFLCDNEAVVKSSTFAESTLKKKHCSIAFHKVRECVAAGRLLIYHERSESNVADLLTKSLSYRKRHNLIRALLS